MKKSLAWAGTILMFISSLVSLILSFNSGNLIWYLVSGIFLFVYSIALMILIVDYFQTRDSK